MSRYVPCITLSGLIAAGCATPLTEGPDTSPQNPTAVLETHLVNDGVKGFVPFEGTTRSYTRSDMHREDSTLKGTGTVTRFLVGNNESARIERLDRRLVWTLDPKEKTYTECPLKVCGGHAATPPATRPSEKPAEKPKEPDCAMKIAAASFTVKPTGEKRAINGFDTEQYLVSWVVTLQDPKARKTTSTLAVDLWTTALTAPLKEAQAMQQAYAKAYATEVIGTTVSSDKTVVVPAEAGRLIDAYLAPMMGAADKSGFLKAGKDLDKVKGYPILTKLTWDMKGTACAEQAEGKAAEEKPSLPTGKGDLLSSVTDFFVKKRSEEVTKEMADKPFLSFTSEVKAYRVEPVHDSVFNPPGNFRPVSPK
ncbi:MAG: hypothetical protein U1F52_13150 [Burkholderiales bacterium]